MQPTSNAPTNPNSSLVKYIGQSQIETFPWLEAAQQDPDPRVRLHAIESWAAKPGNTLDPATYALVDPDETIRARAQQLLEEELARKP